MSTPMKKRAPVYEGHVELTDKEKWQLAVGLGAALCGIILVLGFATYLFGAETTMDATVGTLALGAIVSLAAIVCLRAFTRRR
jgi:hypothetical protein